MHRHALQCFQFSLWSMFLWRNFLKTNAYLIQQTKKQQRFCKNKSQILVHISLKSIGHFGTLECQGLFHLIGPESNRRHFRNYMYQKQFDIFFYSVVLTCTHGATLTQKKTIFTYICEAHKTKESYHDTRTPKRRFVSFAGVNLLFFNVFYLLGFSTKEKKLDLPHSARASSITFTRFILSVYGRKLPINNRDQNW